MARNAAVKAAVKTVWPAVDPAKLVLRLLGDAEFLAEHAEGVLDAQEQKTILWTKPARSVKSRSVGGGRGADRRGGRPRPAHALPRTWCRRGAGPVPHAVPAVGPPLHEPARRPSWATLAQGTTPWATRSWEER
ncbi:hypothetical protein GCM10023238_29070 [Streptomyces heliomycini]